MQTNKQKHIEQLLERFFDGQTSKAEEQELYVFFNSSGIPEALRSYQSVFAYFETGIKEEFSGQHAKTERPSLKSSGKTWLWIGTGIAVSLLFFLVYSLGFDRPAPFNPYEGSYIVRNGVRITDMKEILPELEYSLHEVELQQEKAEQIARQVNRKEKLLRDREINAVNPYLKILKENPNKYFRQELKWILCNE